MPGYEQSELSFFEESPAPTAKSKPPASTPSPVPPPSPIDPGPIGITRAFLGWERPLVDLAAAHLARDWDPATDPVLDLSHHLVIVPTQHAGRRLRERLASDASERGDAAVIPPLVSTPEFLTSPALLKATETPVASHAQTLVAMIDLLLKIDLEHYRRLFPVDPVERNFSWALKTASDLLRMRSLLGEAGLSVGEATQILSDAEKEPERWRDISRIDRTLSRLLEEAGLMDRPVAQRLAVSEGILPPEIRAISVIGEPDTMPLAVNALRHHARSLPLNILIYAPESFAQLFDEMGHPVIPAWINREIDLPNPRETVHPAAHPTHQAERTIELLGGYEAPPVGTLAIGVPDPEVIAPLEKSLGTSGWGVYDPAGLSIATHGIFYLLRTLQPLITGRSYASFVDLLRIPGVAEIFESNVSQLLRQFDELEGQHLPDTIDDALTIAARNTEKQPILLKALTWIDRWLHRLNREAFDATLLEFLAEIYSDRTFHSNSSDDSIVTTIADQINKVLDDLEGPITASSKRQLNAADRLELLLHLLQDQVYYPDRAASDIDLQGWLELLWEDAPHLVLTGMNDGRVPESIIGHPFLPDSARVLLGLRNNESRLARDAYLLTSLLEMRQENGRVDIVFGRTSESGDPLRPSRLLFACSDDELPGRTLQLFDAPVPNAGIAPWELAFQLKPEPLVEDATIRTRISPTRIRAYLACPFRFYLRYGLGMEAVEPVNGEMNQRSFGSHIHSALERLALDETMRLSSDAKEIRDYLEEQLDRIVHGTYGKKLTVPLLIQLESARQRLAWWSVIEAEQREAGWEILDAEYNISAKDGSTPEFRIGDHCVSGQVDRIERHRDTGVIRLLDFKTGGRKGIEEAHLAYVKRTEDPESFPEWARTTNAEGKEAHWIDLQLPLYQFAMSEIYPNATIEIGYATLARAKNEVALDTWDTLSEEQLRSARRCAEGVIESIRNEQFWPPAENVTYDDFSELFFGDVEHAIDPSELVTRLESSL